MTEGWPFVELVRKQVVNGLLKRVNVSFESVKKVCIQAAHDIKCETQSSRSGSSKVKTTCLLHPLTQTVQKITCIMSTIFDS